MRAILVCICIQILTGCGGHYEHLSSGSIGCPPEQITVSDEEMSGNSTTWRATCQGRTYDCTQVGTAAVTCTQEH